MFIILFSLAITGFSDYSQDDKLPPCFYCTSYSITFHLFFPSDK